MALPTKNRLKSKTDFNDVFKKGHAVKGSFLLVKYKKHSNLFPRFGFIIPARVVKRAVDRNKVKRFLTQQVQRVAYSFKGHDVIIILSKNAGHPVLAHELETLLFKIIK